MKVRAQDFKDKCVWKEISTVPSALAACTHMSRAKMRDSVPHTRPITGLRWVIPVGEEITDVFVLAEEPHAQQQAIPSLKFDSKTTFNFSPAC